MIQLLKNSNQFILHSFFYFIFLYHLFRHSIAIYFGSSDVRDDKKKSQTNNDFTLKCDDSRIERMINIQLKQRN